jgi:Leucine-rich repeat (LRR) protein
LQKLSLYNNQISEIKENAFAGLTSLQMLFLSNNQIRKIKENAFAGLTSLRKLSLSNNQIGEIKANVFDPLLNRIYRNSALKNTMHIDVNGINIYQHELIKKYIHHSNSSAQQLCREYCLRLLLNNQLQEPEAIKLLANEICTGVIQIAEVYPAKTLDWICRLLNNHNLPILSFLAKNKNSGFHQDDWQSVIKHTQLVAPPSPADIRESLENKLMGKFNLIKENIDQDLLLGVIDTFTTGNGVAQHVDNKIKERITIIISRHNLNLTEEQINTIITQVKSTNPNRSSGIRNALANTLPDSLENRDTVKATLTFELAAIDKIAIQKSIVQTTCEGLGIKYADHHYAKLEKFCDWQDALSNYTSVQFKELAGKTMADIDKFKGQPEIYSNLISSCSPYLTLGCIKVIVETKPLTITQACKEELDVIKNYGETYDVSDEDPTKALFINGDPQQVLLIEELSHLNPRSTDLTLEKINLITLKLNSAPKKTPLNAKSFNEIETRLPIWLAQSIKEQLTVANTMAKTVDKYFNDIMMIDHINLSEEMKYKLTSIFYANSQNLGLDLNISLEDKKSIMSTLKDQQIEDANIEAGGAFFSKQFAEVLENCVSKYRKEKQTFTAEAISNDELRTLPEKLIHELQSKPYFKCIQDLVEELETEFTKYEPLRDIKLHEIYHLLDIYFANLASIHGLGYHQTIRGANHFGSAYVREDNRSFQRFRLYAAICLSQCVISAENHLSKDQKLEMCKEIKNLLFTPECAGQIANRLYGDFSSFNTLTKRMQGILHTRMIA